MTIPAVGVSLVECPRDDPALVAEMREERNQQSRRAVPLQDRVAQRGMECPLRS